MTSRGQEEEVYVAIGLVSYLWFTAVSKGIPDTFQLCIRCGVPFEIILQLAAFHLPEYFVVIFPTLILLGTFFLSGNTILGCWALFHRKHILVSLGLLASLMSFGVNEFVVPSATRIWLALEWVALYHGHGGGLHNVTHSERASNQNFGRAYFMRDPYGTESQNVIAVDFAEGEIVKIIQADEIQFKESELHLKHARVITALNGAYSKLKFENLKVGGAGNLQRALRYQETPRNEMSARDLAKYLNVLKSANDNDVDLLTRYLQKLISPIDCLIATLLGGQLALLFGQSRKTLGLACAAVVLIIYHVVQIVSFKSGSFGRLDPLFAAALPTIFLSQITLILHLSHIKLPQIIPLKVDLRFLLRFPGMLP